MIDRHQAARAALQALRERYRAQRAQIVGRLMALAGELAAAPASKEIIESIRREAHRLHGTAGTYGFNGVSVHAAELERLCTAWARNPGEVGPPLATDVERCARAIHEAFDELP